MGKKGVGNDAAQVRADEQQRQARIREGTAQIDKTFNGQFTPDFFQKRQQAYVDYANPQVDEQYRKAKQDLTYALARSGNLDSSARGTQEAELQRTNDLARQQIADQGLTMKTDAMNNVESARADLIRTLNATGDAQGAASSALTRASALSQPTGMSPIGNLFGSFTSALNTQAGLERAAVMSGGMVQPRYNTGLFGGSSAVKVTA